MQLVSKDEDVFCEKATICGRRSSCQCECYRGETELIRNRDCGQCHGMTFIFMDCRVPVGQLNPQKEVRKREVNTTSRENYAVAL